MSARVADPKPPRMTVDEFLVWYEEQPGRYALVEGEIVAMSPARARHGLTKFATQTALVAAIKRAGLPCEMSPDGLGVGRPSQLVRAGRAGPMRADPGPERDRDGDPVMVVEVLSLSTTGVDTGLTFSGYFGLPSVAHYLVLDPEERVVVHHSRTGADVTTSRILRGEGSLTLDPPGLELAVSDLFPTE